MNIGRHGEICQQEKKKEQFLLFLFPVGPFSGGPHIIPHVFFADMLYYLHKATL
jgi:hypothetical protein